MGKTDKATEVFNGFRKALDERGWTYNADAEKKRIEFDVRGNDLDMNIDISIYSDRNLFMLLSRLPFNFPEDKRFDGAIATTVLNYNLNYGNFDLNMKNGSVFFRISQIFPDTVSGAGLYSDVIDNALGTVDKHNDELFMISKGVVSLDKFMEDNV